MKQAKVGSITSGYTEEKLEDFQHILLAEVDFIFLNTLTILVYVMNFY